MMLHQVYKKVTGICFIVILLLSTLLGGVQVQAAQSSDEYISSSAFTKKMLKAMNVKLNSADSYIARAKELGILNDGEINEKTLKMTRVECALLLERADEYLNKETVSDELIDEIRTERLSDISKVSVKRQKLIAAAYAKGLMSVDLSEDFSETACFNPNEYVTQAEATEMIEKLLDKSKRTACAENGKMVKTENLPENAADYSVIYASIPNDFYEIPFQFESYSAWGTKAWQFTENEQYTYPVNMNLANISEFIGTNVLDWTYEEYEDVFAETARNYLECMLDHNYYDDGTTWETAVRKAVDGQKEDYLAVKLVMTKAQMYKYKACIETSQIYIDPDMIYLGIDGIHVRAYVKYRITTEDSSLTEELSQNLSSLFICKSADLSGCEIGEWSEAYFDLKIKRDSQYIGGDYEFGVDPNIELDNLMSSDTE